MLSWQQLWRSRHRLGVQLYVGIGGAVLLTMIASLVGWSAFNRVGEVQRLVNDGSIPEMETAFRVAQQSGNLVAAAPRLTVAAVEDFAAVSAQVAQERQLFEAQLDDLLLQVGGAADIQAAVRTNAAALIANIETLESDVEVLFALSDRSDALQAELAALQFALDRLLAEAIDDQIFYVLTGYHTLGQPAAPRLRHTAASETDRYRRLSELHADTTLATQLLANAFTVSEEPLLEPLRERFEAVVGRITLSLLGLGQDPWRAQVTPTFERLFALGIPSVEHRSIFDLVAQEIRLRDRQSELIELNRAVGVEFVADVEVLVDGARARAQEAAQASTQAIQTGRSLLLVVNVVGIAGALTIAWLFVGRILLQRLNLLSDRMRGMAEGDLEAAVQIQGQDEIAEMAAALEVFRRHALEVQRLNLVEKLAEELRDKNDQLEQVLADLQRTQNQMVVREKLAALGELSAGVAHEIRNPLNFVKNFAEASEELLEELQEETERTLGAAAAPASGDPQELLQEISRDLTDNLARIRFHCERADRIVQSMLKMGRGSGELQPTDLNRLLDENTRLAYHSARANDQEFQLVIEMDLGDEVGEIEAVSQDLGRVFLNMVSNACYATNEKRCQRAEAHGSDADSYVPTLWLKTRRMEHGVLIAIRDNGNGIPPEIVDKIFNPFFTTKPTDQGTGLGLSMSNDIIRQHDGTITVSSEPGQFTEMTIELPTTPPSRLIVASSQASH